jgi:serine/threonine-protein kinase
MDWGLAKVVAEGGVADEEKASRSRQRPEDGTVVRTTRSGSAGSGSDTEAGSLLGTPAYMPPEQANGDVALLDRRADVFGLGALLCEVLTGQPPYVGRSSEEVRRKAANGDLADALTRLAGCGADAELIALTMKCLSPEASDRPRDAQAVTDRLTAYLEGVQARLHQAELAEAEATARAQEEAKRRRLTLALAATVLLALTLGGGGWLWVRADRDARQAKQTRDVNEALNRVTTLREQAKGASVGGAALFAQAREQAQRALALVENGPADAALLERVTQLQAELDEEEKDLTLLAALDAARLAQAETVADESRFAFERAVPLFHKAFAAYGLSVGQGEPATTAARIRRRPAAVRETLSAVLDEWIDLATQPSERIAEPHLDWLRAVARAAEPDEGWTPQLQAALREKDPGKRRPALEKLAGALDSEKVPPQVLTRLARRLREVQAQASAVALLRRAHQRYPADFWINHDLGKALLAIPGTGGEAVRYLQAAVALRPESPGVHLNLGNALQARGQLEEAVACYRQAIALDPKYAMARYNLGNALKAQGQVEQAIVCYRQAIDLDPKYARTHNNLGTTLATKGQLEEAIVCFHKSIALDPKYATAHSNLGIALKDKGQLEEAIACYRKAVELDPTNPKTHNSLGAALHTKGQREEAIACYRQAIALDSTYVSAHANLGAALKAKGQLEEAIACFHKAVALDPKFTQAHTNLARAQRLVSGRDKLSAFRTGSYTPATAEERLGLAEWCALQKLHHTAAGLFAATFTADPMLADDLNAAHRYNAACSAAWASAGQGEDAATLDARERSRRRRQALDWLRADLTLRQKQLQSSEHGEADQARAALQYWQQDAGLAGIRDEAALARLPATEREACNRLWADVAALLKSKDRPTPKEPKP